MINRILVILLLILLSSSAWGATQQNKIAWEELTVDEQELLRNGMHCHLASSGA